MKKILLLLLVPVFIFSNCNKEASESEESSIVGYWINPQPDGDLLYFQGVNGLIKDHYGIVFFGNGQFIERDYTGWCLTEPIPFEDYEGTWTMENERIEISINRDEEGDVDYYSWDLILVSNSVLVVKPRY
ncbi:MAG: hypothetical protein DWQ02_06960 [Bacteroidetes bacterium]|nr:MAG: hypothetical protein DWQ02_06960 [Bacteroidota bacterium]